MPGRGLGLLLLKMLGNILFSAADNGLSTVWAALVTYDGSTDHLIIRTLRVPRAHGRPEWRRAWLTPPSAAGYSRALPLRFMPAIPEKAVRPAGMAAHKEWEAGLAELHWLRGELDHAGRQAQPVLSLGDGHFSNQFGLKSV